ncbi:LysR substrate-binding domain-containing protein [Kiloniella laminariae]|uniref:LysR substrate-binding domain-containing protein n=1 Tax=Kiloniella laminariae TaxID=454162 RepID=A0ABT4LK79_9PROT|nr:LysR substrate-binding domain-containing protein [Kiloniella laminariae]MCZ4281489.1 LysR substrate-binding domain-containing protein [Kiloniella laminariae]
MRDLPPLKALRAFEACYRLRSFTRAAAQLNVGQPAISHQIRQLERDLGFSFFTKKGSLIFPTVTADLYYEKIAPALGIIADASRNLRQKSTAPLLTLATYPGIAAYWALPRLGNLIHKGKKLPVRVITAERDADIELNQTDCAILFGRGNWPGRDCIKLISEEVVPLAAPGLAGKLKGLTPAQLLKKAPLIHQEDPEHRWFDWSDWAQYFIPDRDSTLSAEAEGIRVTNHGLAIHQAIMGQGVTLGWLGVVQDLLESQALVPLHHKPLLSDRGYWLVTPPDFLQSDIGIALVKAFSASEPDIGSQET